MPESSLPHLEGCVEFVERRGVAVTQRRKAALQTELVTHLPQLRVFRLGILQDGDIRVGIFP